MRLNNVLVVYMKLRDKEHNLTLNTVKDVLENQRINFKVIRRKNLKQSDFKNKDLVIAVGGDGTFLRAAQFIEDKTPILGVNSDIKEKEGFFLSANKFNFEGRLKKIIKNKFKIKKLARLEAKIGNKRIKEASLNEFYVGTAKAYDTFRCILKVRGKKERQKNSGVLVGAASGSYAWLKSCKGKILPLESEKFQYVVREPYYGKLTRKCKLVKGLLNKNQIIEIKSQSDRGILVADSLGREHKLSKGSVIRIGVSKNKLRVVWF